MLGPSYPCLKKVIQEAVLHVPVQLHSAMLQTAVEGARQNGAIPFLGVFRTYGKVCPSPSFCYRSHFSCYSPVRTHRFGHTEITEGSAGQVLGTEVASGDKTASGSKVGPVYI